AAGGGTARSSRGRGSSRARAGTAGSIRSRRGPRARSPSRRAAGHGGRRSAARGAAAGGARRASCASVAARAEDAEEDLLERRGANRTAVIGPGARAELVERSDDDQPAAVDDADAA